MIAYAQMFFIETLKLFQRSSCMHYVHVRGMQTCGRAHLLHAFKYTRYIFDTVNREKENPRQIHVYARFCNSLIEERYIVVQLDRVL